MRNRLCVTLFSLILTVSAGSTTPASEKPEANSKKLPGGSVGIGPVAGWEFSDEQRIAERVAMGHDHDRAHINADAESYSESIDGHRNPHLFFAYELFDQLIWGVGKDAKLRANAHMLFDSKIRAHGYDLDAFWHELERIAGPYLTLRDVHRKQQHNTTILKLPSGKQLIVFVDRDVCAARFSALAETRRAFGNRDFDRFLYTAVAPEIGISGGGSATDRAEELRYIARGCK